MKKILAHPAASGSILFTRIDAKQPSLLTKRFALGDGGDVKKSSIAQLTAGRATRVSVDTLEEFAAYLDSLPPSAALTYGLSADSVLVSESRIQHHPGAITRTRKHFAYEEKPGLLMGDHDPVGSDMLDPAALLQLVRGLTPCLNSAPMLWRPSASSGVARPGETGRLTGQRLYIPVRDASLIPAAGKALTALLWAAGYGRIVIGKAGQALERTPLDSTVWQPERLDFAAAPVVVAPLTRDVPPAFVSGAGEWLDARLLIAAGDAVAQQAAAARYAARCAAKPQLAAARDAWIDATAPALAQRQRIDISTARASLQRAAEHLELDEHAVLHCADGRRVTVRALLDNPTVWHEQRFADPLEPDYGGDKRIAYADLTAGRPSIYSHAHGGRRFYLVRSDASQETEEPVDIALSEKSDYAADISRLIKSPSLALARKIAARYAWQSPARRTFAELADELAAPLPMAAQRSIRRYVRYLERKARARAIESSTLNRPALSAAGIDIRTVDNLRDVPAMIEADSDALYLIRAGHGAGKTELVLGPLSRLPGCVVAVSPRVSLVADMCARLSLSNYQTLQKSDVEFCSELGICAPSLINPKFSDVLSRASIVLVDEIGATLRELHSLSGPAGKKGRQILRRLVAMLSRAEIAACADADLSTRDALLLARLTGRRVVVIEQPEASHGRTVRHADADVIKQRILDALGDDEHVRVACDSSRAAIELAAMIRDRSPEKRVLCIQSRAGDSTAGDADVLAFLADVNNEVTKIDCLIHSPTVESGVSITVPHFDRTFGLFSGRSVSPAGFIQMLRRDRTATEYEIGLAGAGLAFEPVSKLEILNSLEATHRRTVAIAEDCDAIAGIVRIEAASSFDADIVDYLAARNVDCNTAHQNLLLLLESRGFAVEKLSGNKLAKETKQRARALADDAYIDAVMTAADITDEQRAAIEQRYQPGADESAAAEKHDAATCVGITPAQLTADDLRLWEHGRLSNQVRLYSMATRAPLAGADADADDARIEAPLALRRHELATAEACRHFFDVIGLDLATGAGDITDESAADAWRSLSQSECRPALEHARIARFDRPPAYPVRWLGDVLAKFGLSLESHGRQRTYVLSRTPATSKDGRTVKAPGLDAMQRIAAQRSHMRQEKKKILGSMCDIDIDVDAIIAADGWGEI